MKKLVFLILAITGLGFVATAQKYPAFTGTKSESAMLIYLKPFGTKVKDNVVIVNQASMQTLTSDIYVYDTKKEDWVLFGSGVTKDINDKARVQPKGKESGIGKYEFIAVVPADGQKYTYATTAKDGELYLYLKPMDTSFFGLGSKAVVIDTIRHQGKAKGTFLFEAKSTRIASTGMYIFGDRGNGFEFIGAGFLKAQGDICSLETSAPCTPSDFSRIAVVSTDGLDYTYASEVLEKEKDLRIYLRD